MAPMIRNENEGLEGDAISRDSRWMPAAVLGVVVGK